MRAVTLILLQLYTPSLSIFTFVFEVYIISFKQDTSHLVVFASMALDSDKRNTFVDFGGFREVSSEKSPPVKHQGRQMPWNDKRPIAHSGHGTGKVIKGGIKDLALQQLNQGSITSKPCILRHESPWDTYRATLSCEIAGSVIIAAQRSDPTRVIAIRQYTNENLQPIIENFRRLSHENILSAQECFITDDSLFVLVEDLPLSLEHLVGCRTLYPTESELASMLWQVSLSVRTTSERLTYLSFTFEQILAGLCYLSENGWEHQALQCRNILLGLDGSLRIGAFHPTLHLQPRLANSDSASTS